MTHFEETPKRHAKLTSAKQALLEKRLQAALSPDSRYQVIPLRPDQSIFPLSFAQERMWFLDQWEPDNSAYNRPVGLRLAGRLDVPALERTLGEILRRHEVLRATFQSRNGQLAQVITPARPVCLPLVQVPRDSPAARELEARRLATSEAQRPLDLAQGPLFRAVLLRLDEQDHVLIVVIHHIVFDAWSATVFRQELATIYGAFSAGQPSPLGELSMQYSDYAAWQRNRLQGNLLDTQIAYWQRQLEGAPSLLELPADHPRPPVQTYWGTREDLRLSPELTRALAALSERENATLFMTLLSALVLLLYRLTEQTDIVVGAPVASRSWPGTERMIGPFLNNLVLRSDLSGNPTFLHLLHRIRQTALDAYDHQDVPFELLLEKLQPERDPSRTPLFQIYFNMHPTERPGFALSGLSAEPFELSTFESNYDLTVLAAELDGAVRVHFVYNADLFEALTIKRLVGHYRTLLEAIVTEPEAPILQLPLLTEDERYRLLVEWNDTRVEYDRDGCVQHLFEAQVERTPNAVAVQAEGKVLSYRDLNARANQVAHYLQKHSVGPEVLVGICIERSLEMMIGILGILKAGGAYLALDLSLPPERLAFMIEDAGTTILLTQENVVAELPERQTEVICLDTDWEAIAEESEENPTGRVSAENLVHVHYTSGSTGVPKGVAMHHRPLHNLILWMIQNSGLLGAARTLQFSPLSFDVSFAEMFWCWASGGTLVLITEELRQDMPCLLDFVTEESVERVILPVIALQQMAEAAANTGTVPCSIGEIVTTAEQLQITPPVMDLLDGLANCTLHNLYGPTETHVVSSLTLMGSPEDWPPLPPIGRPIANIQIYLLDTNLQPVPVGVTGELYIGGDCLARGYLNRPGLTADRFISNPFGDVPGARLYRTGDLARYLPDGNLEFLGRSDHQVKLRGFRVELGEVEAVLVQYPGVQDVVAQVKEGMQGNQQLVAYVVLGRSQSPVPDTLRSFLQERLPDHMVPAAFVMLESLPLTPSGKVNRRALPDPDWSRRDLAEVFVAPRTPVEEVLAGIWVQVLGVKAVGVHDNFFELGGHSLRATQVMNRISASLQVDLPLRSLFETPTVAGLSETIIAWESSPGWVLEDHTDTRENQGHVA